MTTTHGNDGTIYIGANVMAELVSYTLTEEATVADDSILGDAWDTHIPNKATRRWTGEATTRWDPSDVNGQEALQIGAGITINLYPAGNVVGKSYRFGQATVMSVGVTVNRANAVERTFRFQGNGILNQGSV